MSDETTESSTPNRAEKIAAKVERTATAKAVADRIEAEAIAKELAALKAQIKGIDSNQSGAIDALCARIAALGITAPKPAES